MVWGVFCAFFGLLIGLGLVDVLEFGIRVCR